MRNLFLFSLLFFFSTHSYAQQKYSFHASQFQLEILGPGSLYSLNFDSRFQKKEKGLGYRIGLGVAPLGTLGVSCNRGSQITLPVGLNYLVGKKDHYAEIGAGLSLTVIGGTKRYCTAITKTFFSDETTTYKYILAGYRYQRNNKKGITYRAFVSPLLQSGFDIKFWGGVSIGYRF